MIGQAGPQLVWMEAARTLPMRKMRSKGILPGNFTRKLPDKANAPDLACIRELRFPWTPTTEGNRSKQAPTCQNVESWTPYDKGANYGAVEPQLLLVQFPVVEFSIVVVSQFLVAILQFLDGR